jgi:hypothetical protein
LKTLVAVVNRRSLENTFIVTAELLAEIAERANASGFTEHSKVAAAL